MTPRRTPRLLAFLLCWCLGTATAGELRTPDELADLETTADYAFYSEDAHLLARLVQDASALAASDSTLERYQYAHAAFRQLQRAVFDRDGKLADRAGNGCVRALDGLLERSPHHAEAMALRATCSAYLALAGGLRAQALALRVGADLEEASTLAPRNPRVLLARGLARWYRHDAGIADRAAARADFEASANLFDTLRVTPPGEPSWGGAEAWFYVGHAAAAAGDLLVARSAFEKALLIAPDFAAARRALHALAATP
jgi:hypothetical protein